MRKQKFSKIKHCLQIQADSTQLESSCNEDEPESATFQSSTKSTAKSAEQFEQLLGNKKSSIHSHTSTLTRCQSSPKMITTISRHLPRPSAVERTKLHFTKFQTKSGPGEPPRPYYCVRISKNDNKNSYKVPHSSIKNI